jgi:hypothetical protein
VVVGGLRAEEDEMVAQDVGSSPSVAVVCAYLESEVLVAAAGSVGWEDTAEDPQAVHIAALHSVHRVELAEADTAVLAQATAGVDEHDLVVDLAGVADVLEERARAGGREGHCKQRL